MSFLWHTAGEAMTGRELLARLHELDMADPAALDSTIDMTCPDIEDPWSVGQISHHRGTIMLAPYLGADEDEDEDAGDGDTPVTDPQGMGDDLRSRHDAGANHGTAAQPTPPAARVMTRQSSAPLTALWTSASNRYVEDHTNGIRRGSIVLDPPYQRGSVWTLDQRIALMKSWLLGVPVAAITLNNRMGREWEASDPHARVAYAVVDGRQRLETALAWEDGNLAIPASWLPAAWIDTTEDTNDGPYVRSSGLTEPGRRRVHNLMNLPCVIAKLPDITAEAELYLLVNGAGTPQTAADLTNAARIAER
ncbi:DUF262 domain-containing protein [Actinomycetes bacterium KLBMP 9797]